MGFTSLADFKKLDLRVGRIVAAESIAGSEKLVKLTVSLGRFGDPDAGENVEEVTRTLVAGIGQDYAVESLPGRQIVVATNLEPKVMMGVASQGMLLAAEDEKGRPVLLMPEREVPDGSVVR
jgi:methionyl-tRNA synthetase